MKKEVSMLESLAFVLALNAVGFLIAFARKSDKLTDISYALSFSAITIYGISVNEATIVQWVVAVVVLCWAARLGGFLLYRVHYTGRDQRFDEMRNSFFAFGRFWLLQAVTSWLVMIPAILLFFGESRTSLTTLTVVGLGIALFGLIIEGVADWQKFRFSKRKTGAWIEEGLWRYSRHPNYFGEMCMWIGIYIAVVEWLPDWQPFIALISPLLISALLLFVSGIPILERNADKRWGKQKAYQNYKKRTSVLVPLPNSKD